MMDGKKGKVVVGYYGEHGEAATFRNDGIGFACLKAGANPIEITNALRKLIDEGKPVITPPDTHLKLWI